MIQQRRRIRVDQEPHEPVHHRRGQLRGALCVAALQRVLHFQPQLHRQWIKTDGLIRREGDGVEGGCESSDSTSSGKLPGVGVAVAERQRALRPKVAVHDRADRAGSWCADRWWAGQPGREVAAPAAFPPSPVLRAEALPGDPEAAAGRAADTVRALTLPTRIGGGGELDHVRATGLLPTAVVTLTQTMAARGPGATRNPASGATEHDVARREHERLGAELRADR